MVQRNMTPDTPERSGSSFPTPASEVPAGLAASSKRVASSRDRAKRSLERARLRRRMMPPFAVGSALLVGTAAVGGWVRTVAHVPAATGSAPATSSLPQSNARTSASSQQLALDAQALQRLARTLAAERAAIAAMGNSTTAAIQRAASAAASSGGGGGSSSTIVSSGGPVSGGSAPVSSGGGSVSLPPLPSLPTINVPSAPPPTHATTGPSSAG
jgi:hypothetical protein